MISEYIWKRNKEYYLQFYEVISRAPSLFGSSRPAKPEVAPSSGKRVCSSTSRASIVDSVPWARLHITRPFLTTATCAPTSCRCDLAA